MQIYQCFPGGKTKALTMSYDDGRTADRRLVDVFNRYDIKGTFHINSGLLDQPDMLHKSEIKDLFQGHEVSAHSVTHPMIARCPKEQIVAELLEDRQRLEEIVEYPIRGISYPYGSHNQHVRQILPHLGFEYARVVEETQGLGIPEDFLQWRATCHHQHNLMKHGKQLVELKNQLNLCLLYVWGHSFEFDHNQNWDLIEDFCALVGKRDDIWYATNIEIVDYFNEWNRLQFSASMKFVYNPSATSLWITVGGKVLEIKGGQQIDLV